MTRWTLIGAGGIIGLIKALMLYHRKHSYIIASYNMGTLADFENVSLAGTIASSHRTPLSAEDAVAQLRETEKPPFDKQQLMRAKSTLLRSTFAEFREAHTDFICLQEHEGFDLTSSLPECYMNTYSGNCSLIAWNSSKFELLSQAQFSYDDDSIGMNSSSDTILLFRDRRNGVRICVTSAYLRGYNLATPRPQDCARGDYQTAFDLHAMSQIQADLYIFAGDYNVPRPCPSSDRLTQLISKGFITDERDCAPTIFDGNLRDAQGRPQRVKLDHIYARGKKVTVQQHPVSSQTLDSFRRPSDHIPVGARITIRA